MITLAQEICCLDCKYAHFYFSNINSCFDKIVCQANGNQNGWSGCSRYSTNHYPLKHYSYDNRFMDSITNIFDGSQLRVGDICRQTLGRMGQ